MLMHLWFDTDHKSKEHYLRKKVGELNKRIQCITPPKAITRLTSNFLDHGRWKASEYRSFILFYSVPCMWGILPLKYFIHLMLLVEATYILLKSSISQEELNEAKQMLVIFCSSVESLYGARYETSNVHALLHISQKVKDLGPLFCHSCFHFEDLNKDLRKLFHGTQKVELQIALAVTIQQQIPGLVCQIPKGSAAERLYDHMTKRLSIKVQIPIGKGNFAIGPFRKWTLPQSIAADMMSEYGLIVSVEKYFRAVIGGKIFHSEEYVRVFKRNNYVVQYVKEDTVAFGAVQFYLKCMLVSKEVNVAVIKCLSLVQDDDGLTQYLPPVMTHVKAEDNLIIVPVDLLSQVVVYLNVDGLEEVLVAVFPNFIEGD